MKFFQIILILATYSCSTESKKPAADLRSDISTFNNAGAHEEHITETENDLDSASESFDYMVTKRTRAFYLNPLYNVENDPKAVRKPQSLSLNEDTASDSGLKCRGKSNYQVLCPGDARDEQGQMCDYFVDFGYSLNDNNYGSTDCAQLTKAIANGVNGGNPALLTNTPSGICKPNSDTSTNGSNSNPMDPTMDAFSHVCKLGVAKQPVDFTLALSSAGVQQKSGFVTPPGSIYNSHITSDNLTDFFHKENGKSHCESSGNFEFQESYTCDVPDNGMSTMTNSQDTFTHECAGPNIESSVRFWAHYTGGLPNNLPADYNAAKKAVLGCARRALGMTKELSSLNPLGLVKESISTYLDCGFAAGLLSGNTIDAWHRGDFITAGGPMLTSFSGNSLPGSDEGDYVSQSQICKRQETFKWVNRVQVGLRTCYMGSTPPLDANPGTPVECCGEQNSLAGCILPTKPILVSRTSKISFLEDTSATIIGDYTEPCECGDGSDWRLPCGPNEFVMGDAVYTGSKSGDSCTWDVNNTEFSCTGTPSRCAEADSGTLTEEFNIPLTSP